MVVASRNAGAFELGGGAPGLDFVNTLDGRLEPAPLERLAGYDDLLAFSLATGGLNDDEATMLLTAAERNPETALSVLEWAVEVREALYRAVRSRLSATPVDPLDLATLGDAIADAGANERLVDAQGHVHMGWRAVDDEGSVHLDRPLWPVARSAALLLTGQLPGTLRACAADDCAVLFLDTTRNQSRRWCSRTGCGNRERVRKFRRRRAQA
ncbi:MAG TPA: CGNR zinc finger domain-containing protein [Thermomicrobiales bacterium]|nr:CGNR zinc finger domain-containing protein [Thermomicrobiales bacterium]